MRFINPLVDVFSYFKIISHKHLYVEATDRVDSKNVVYQGKGWGLCASKPQHYYQKCDLLFFCQRNPYVALLTNATIFGASELVFLNNKKALYELFYFDEDSKFEYTDAVIRSCMDGKLAIRYKATNKTIKNGIMLSGKFSLNYYHFILETLTKFMLLDKIDIPKYIPLIVDHEVSSVPQLKELLNYFNVDNREIIYLERRCNYKIKNLYYASHINIIPPNYKNIDEISFTDCKFDIESINFVRNKLLQLKRPISNIKNIYLSRQNASSPRRRYNENAVINIFKKYGFEIVFPEKHSVAEQITLFNSADFVAGVTGAAFTNILFCKKGCKVLCIQSAKNDLSVFSTIAKCLKLDMQYFSAYDESRKNKDLHEEFVVDLVKIESVLLDFLSNGQSQVTKN